MEGERSLAGACGRVYTLQGRSPGARASGKKLPLLTWKSSGATRTGSGAPGTCAACWCRSAELSGAAAAAAGGGPRGAVLLPPTPEWALTAQVRVRRAFGAGSKCRWGAAPLARVRRATALLMLPVETGAAAANAMAQRRPYTWYTR